MYKTFPYGFPVRLPVPGYTYLDNTEIARCQGKNAGAEKKYLGPVGGPEGGGKAWYRSRFRLPPALVNRNVRITRSGFGYLGLVVALSVAAFNTGNNLLYLILALVLAALPVSFLLSEYMIAELRLRRISESILDEFPSIGERRKAALLKKFGSIQRIRMATVEQIAEVPGFGGKAAAELKAFLDARSEAPLPDVARQG